MPNYRVSFYKTLLTSDGHPSRCLQECIDVCDLKDATEAAQAASKAFEARHGLRDWKVYADTIDVALVPGADEDRSERRRASVTARRRARSRA